LIKAFQNKSWSLSSLNKLLLNPEVVKSIRYRLLTMLIQLKSWYYKSRKCTEKYENILSTS